MGNSPKSKSLATKLFVTGCIFLVASIVVLVLAAAVGLIPWNRADMADGNEQAWGIAGSTGWFWGALFQVGFSKEPLYHYNMDAWRFFVIVILLVSLILSLIAIGFACVKKDFKKAGQIVLLFVAILYSCYVFISIYVPLNYSIIWRGAFYSYILVFVLALVAVVLLGIPALTAASKALAKVSGENEEEEAAKKAAEVAGVNEDIVRSIVADELAKHVEEKHVEETEETEESVDEEAVRAIVVDELAKHVEEKHAEPVVAAAVVEEPVAEEAPVEEAVEEAEEVEEADDEDEEDEETEEVVEETAAASSDIASKFPPKSKRRRASFETRVKKSDEDLRHKYYELRDYIRSYGVSDRISIPGHTFSAHRERYVFVTIVGKRIKAYFALDPVNYVESPIPVEPQEAKKFEDVKCMLRIKSDLSLRRALKLVDDVMAAKGVEKPEAK